MSFIDSICQKLVCPPKLNYSNFDLGPALTCQARRTDFNVVNANGLRINASFYDNKKNNTSASCVIYLHSMNGSRLESLVYVDQILKMGYTFCNFDFTGCGNSEGKSISFGANEKHDVYAVIELLKLRFNTSKVFLWGRSMGSACAVKYCQMMSIQPQQHPQIQVLGIMLDSCFASFSQLVVQIGHQKVEMPQFIVKAGYYIIKGNLQHMGKFKTEELQLQQCIGSLKVPVLFLASNQDLVVNSEHSKTLYDLYNHKFKKLVYFKGSHNEARDHHYIDSVKMFIKEAESYHEYQKKIQYYEHRSQLNKPQNKEIYFQRSSHHLYNLNQQEKGDVCECSLLPNKTNQVHYYEAPVVVKKNASENIKHKTRLSSKQERPGTKKNLTDFWREGEKVRLSKMNNLQAAESERCYLGVHTRHQSYDFS